MLLGLERSMNNLLESILQSQDGGAVKQIAQSVGINENQVASALSQLVPALAGGIKSNLGAQGGLDSLMGALSGGGHERYVNDPSLLASADSVQDGNGILGHILGSKDASRAVASQVSANTGIGEGALKSMLPMVATLVMGALSKNTGQGNALAGMSGGDDSLLSMLDFNKDGSVMDDVAGLMGKLFRG